MKEVDIQSAILAYLKAKGCWFRRIPVGAVAHGGKRKRSPLAGLPDIMVIIPSQNSRLCFIEVKTKVGRLSEVQEKTLAELRALGVMVILARSVEDVAQYIP